MRQVASGGSGAYDRSTRRPQQWSDALRNRSAGVLLRERTLSNRLRNGRRATCGDIQAWASTLRSAFALRAGNVAYLALLSKVRMRKQTRRERAFLTCILRQRRMKRHVVHSPRG